MALHQRHRFNALPVMTALTTLLAAQPAWTLDAWFEVGAAMDHYSNALRTNENEEADTMQSLLARADASHSSPELEALINYSFETQSYKDDSYEDEDIAEGGAHIDWRVLGDRISLLLDHTTSDTVINSNAPSTPDNRTQRSVLAAGPRFTVHPSEIDNIQLTTRYIDVNVDDLSDSDSERGEATLRWNHRMPQLRNFHFSTSYSDVKFTEQEDQDYEFTTAVVGLSSASAVGTFAGEVGISHVDRDIQKDVDGNSINITWESRPDRSPTRWSVGYINSLTDSSLGLSAESSLPSGGSGAGSDLTVIDIVEREELGLSATTMVNAIHSEVTLTASAEEQDYEESPSDDRIYRGGLMLTRELTHRADAYIYVEKIRQDFLDIDQELEDLEYGIGGSYDIVKALKLRWSVYRLDRDHSIEASSFTDNVYRLELTYGFGYGAGVAEREPGPMPSSSSRSSAGGG